MRGRSRGIRARHSTQQTTSVVKREYERFRPDLAAPLAESVFRSSVRAVSRIEVSRTVTDTTSRGESNRESQRVQNKAPAEGTEDQN